MSREADPDPPEEVRRLVVERDRARRRGDYAVADALREDVRRLGFVLRDTPAGTVAAPAPVPARPPDRGLVDVRGLRNVLDRPPTAPASVLWLAEGWPEDVDRGIRSFLRTEAGRSAQHVVVDPTGSDRAWPGHPEVLRLAADPGWAAARNAGLVRSRGRVVVLVDGSLEAGGDVLPALVDELDRPGAGIVGPFGLVTTDLRTFRPSGGPEVDAIEGYLMALRRELVEAGLRFDEAFRFYRMADVDLSFRVKAMGLSARVVPVPVLRHEHRSWARTPKDRRARLSRRNFYRFLDRWRGRTDLLVAPGSGQSRPGDATRGVSPDEPGGSAPRPPSPAGRRR